MTINLTKGNEKGLLFKLTRPMFWGSLCILLVSLTDTYFIAQLGEKQLAVTGFTLPITMLVISIPFGIGVATPSLVAISLGKGAKEQAAIYTTTSLVLVFLLGVASAILGLLTIGPVFTGLGAKGLMLDLIYEYMEIWYLSVVPVFLLIVGNSAIRATGHIKYIRNTLIIMAVINLFLDIIFVKGYLGFTPMGLYGAGLATTISITIAMLIAMYGLYTKVGLFHLDWYYMSHPSYYIKITKLAFPAMLAKALAPVSLAVNVKFASNIGHWVVAIYGVVMRIQLFFFIVLFALGRILTVFAGQNYGAKLFGRVGNGIKISIKFSLFWGVACIAILAVFGHLIMQMFTTSESVIDGGSLFFYTVPFTYFFLGVILLGGSAAAGMGNTKPIFIMELFRLIVIFIPLLYVLTDLFGLLGLYLSRILADIIVGVCALFWVKRLVFNLGQQKISSPL